MKLSKEDVVFQAVEFFSILKKGTSLTYLKLFEESSGVILGEDFNIDESKKIVKMFNQERLKRKLRAGHTNDDLVGLPWMHKIERK